MLRVYTWIVKFDLAFPEDLTKKKNQQRGWALGENGYTNHVPWVDVENSITWSSARKRGHSRLLLLDV